MTDARYALRGLLRSPGFTAVAILSLALGIGANVTIYTIANAFLTRPIGGVAAPGRLVRVYRGSHSALQYRDLAYVRDNSQVFSGVIGEETMPVALANESGTERVLGALVTPGYFPTLGVHAEAGRLFGVDSLEQSVVLSHNFWRRRFGGDARVVGQTIRVNDRALRIAGVAAPDFVGSMSLWGADLWLSPATAQAVTGTSLDHWGGSLYATARLRDGMSVDRANAIVRTLAGRMVADDSSRGREFSLRVDDASGITAELRQPALVVSGFLLFVVGLVLLIACANVANLLLARATGRRREIAVRIALGARRGQLLRLLLIESGMLAVAASVVGSGVAMWSVGVLGRYVMSRSPEPILLNLAPDGRVLLATVALALFTTILFGLLPALRATSVEVSPVLREAAPQSSGRSRMRSMLVGTQVALCTILLACATLFLRSLANARVIDPGFETAGVVDLPVDLRSRQLDSARGADFYRRLLERANALPGVRSATLAAVVPLGGSNMQLGIWTPDAAGANRAIAMPYFNVVGRDYFRTLGIELVAGRDFDEDATSPADVAVVNEKFARRLAPDGQIANALGRRFSMSGPAGPWIIVIGVARNTKYNTLGEKTPDFLYQPFARHYRAEMVLQVKSSPAGEAALRRMLPGMVRELDPQLPPAAASSLAEDMRVSLLSAQIGAALLGAFGALALLLATMGIYGVASYAVAQRTRELGIRCALGATARDVMGMVLGQSLRVAIVGTAVGLLCAVAVARLIASQLYGVGAADPVTFIGMPACLVTVALLATLVPALRATRVDPVVALRSE
jgi:putative ABC transport system permease protein